MWNLIYAYVFCLSLLLSLSLTPWARRLAIRFKVLDYPGERKLQDKPIPLMGGLAIFLAFLVAITVNILILLIIKSNPGFLNLLPSVLGSILTRNLPRLFNVLPQLIGILLGGIVILLLGLIDDIRGLRPETKILGQVMVILPLITLGVRITLFIPNFYISGLITILWMVAIINAFNILDNMDGLTTGVGLIACFMFFIVTSQQHQTFTSIALIALAGALLGFLRYNFNPAKIFLGDAGSMFIGYMLAVLTITASYYREGLPTHLPVVMPILILAVPIFDTLSVISIRIKRKEPIFGADKNHFSHRLVALGFSQRGAVLLIYLISFCLGITATLLAQVNISGAIVIFIQAAVILCIVALLESVARRDKLN
ncbi:undecaprenyl/decaprenyl-phosphate alpha-N-acetylglucosaminyl 1-phosphate transferase [bacterium]|nr:undecaprenyl/decaprenyl-phosphate alpha-N-acetylglucosaminyl 1-phosphate transferase [bacterium]